MDKSPKTCYIHGMKMKKITLILLVICGTALMMAACASLIQAKAPDDAPKEVKKAVKNAPRNSLIGIGKATGTASSQLSDTIAVARARTAISRQLNTMVRDMISTYRAESSLDASAALAFEENITVVLSGSTLTGSAVTCEVKDNKGTNWAVVVLPRKYAVAEIKRAQTQAKTKVPATAAVDITVHIDSAYDKAVSVGPQVY